MNNAMKNDTLISSEPEIAAEHAPIIRVLLAVSYTGVLSGVMGAMAALLPLISGKDTKENLWLSAAAVIFFSAAAAVLSYIDKRKGKAFNEEQDRLIAEAERFNGKIIACEKYERTVKMGFESFCETEWAFVISYKEASGEDKIIRSGRYYTDLSEVITDDKVTVLKKADGTYAFDSFATGEGEKIRLETRVAEESNNK